MGRSIGIDPLSMVYTALWDLAEETEVLTCQVKLKNRIRYDTSDRDPEKKNYLDSDVPQLTLLSVGLTGNICNTSTTSMLVTRYTWTIVTGDLRIDYRLLPIEWALFVAMHGWREKLGALTWEDKTFVKSANVLDVQEGILRPDIGQNGPRGWAAIWGIDVLMYFDTKDIEAVRSSDDGCT